MEQWFFIKILSIYNFIVKTNITANPTVQYPLCAGGQNPFFQYSIIPTFPQPIFC